MNLRPSNSLSPKYPALAALAVAAVASLSCQQQPQRTAGAPLATPEQLEQLQKQQPKEEKAQHPRERQILGGKMPRAPQRLGGKKVPVSDLSEAARERLEQRSQGQAIPGAVSRPQTEVEP